MPTQLYFLLGKSVENTLVPGRIICASLPTPCKFLAYKYDLT